MHLLKAVEDYGRENGMTEACGPLGFTDLDPEGMLTWGFDQLGTISTIYNYPYYPEHMEKLGGFEKDNDYVEYKLIVPKQIPEKYTKIAEMVSKRYNLHVAKVSRNGCATRVGTASRFSRWSTTHYRTFMVLTELTDRQIMQYLDMGFHGSH